MDKTFEDIKDMLRANYPLIYLTTSEYRRIKTTIRRIGYRLGYDFHAWNVVDGLITHSKTPANKFNKIEQRTH